MTSNGGIFANGGTIDIISGRLTASAGDVIKEATTVKIKDDALLAVRGGDVTLGALLIGLLKAEFFLLMEL